MLSFELLPWEGKNCFLVSYVDLSLREHPASETEVVLRALGKMDKGDRQVLFDTIDAAKAFIDTYLEHFKLYYEKKPAPEGGWIWTRGQQKLSLEENRVLSSLRLLIFSVKNRLLRIQHHFFLQGQLSFLVEK